ncbi:MAG: PilN domain-containing protein [Candidatus Wallbacteria bacterium]|nr:PilN domain-containing protein [Candidatus Wallbacteria bacterium]
MRRLFSSSQVAVEISSSSIKVVRVDFTSRLPRITRASIYALAENNRAGVTSALRRVRNEFDCTRVIAGVLGREVNVKNFLFPHMEKPELRKALHWKIAESLSKSAADYVLNISSPTDTETDSTGVKKLVVVIAVLKQHLNDLTAIFRESGLEVDFIEAQVRALLNLALFNKQLDKIKPVGILDIGVSTSNLSVYENGIVKYARDFPYGADSRTDSSAFGGRISRQITESMEFYRKMFGVKPLQKLLLTGGGSIRTDIFESISSGLDFPVEELKILPSAPGVIPEGSHPVFAVAAGLAVTARKNALFVSSSVGTKFFILLRSQHELTTVAVLASLIAAHLIFFLLAGAGSSVRCAILQSKIRSLESTYSRIHEVETAVKKNRVDTAGLLQLEKRKIHWGDTLLHLSNSLPEGVQITSILQNEGGIALNGKAVEFRMVTELMDALENAPGISSNKLSEAKIGPDGQVAFRLQSRSKP